MRFSEWLVLAVVVALSCLFRVAGLAADLPFMHHPDEPTNLRVVDSMVANGDPNPHFFNYPSLFLYLNAAVHLDGPLLGWLPGLGERAPVTARTGSGAFLTGVGFAPTTGSVLVHRLLTVVFGVGLVVVGWVAARRISSGIAPPALTACLLAFSPTLVTHSRFVTPDMLAALLVGVGVLCALWVFRRGTWTAYVCAGAAIGLAAGAKYTAVLVAVAVVVASVLTKRRQVLLRLPVAGVVAGVFFLLSTPYALLDSKEFLADLEFERQHYATGHDGMEGDTVSYYVDLLVSREGVLVAAALAGLLTVALVLRDRWPVAVILLAFPVVYGVSIAMQTVRNDRTAMLLLAPLAVLPALVVERLKGRVLVTAGAGLAALAVAVATTWPAPGPTTWRQARDWLDERPGTTLLVEAYSPYPDPDRHRIIGRTRLIDGTIPPGTDYVVAAETMYGRYLTGAYPAAEAAYDRLFRQHREVARFTGNGSTIVILDSRSPG
ncbi:MAG TPA: glycosyltransferase family 39 protein [Actinophytocola sp.]|nr:glycosyltransferase family 39 protein [Actinophytocola sp.]